MAKQIDPIYKAYTARIIKYLSSTEFYYYFMSMIESGKNSFQFSNKKVEKTVDETWVAAIEAVIKPMEEIIANPRNFIVQEEVIVNVALAKKVTPDSIRHLAQHGDMIDKVEEDSVRPNRLMNKFKEDSWDTYENKFVYTLLEMAWEFVNKRYEAIFAAMSEEYGAFLKMSTDMSSYHENISANIDIRIRQEEDLLSADEKNETVFSRIARLHRLLGNFRQSNFAQEVAKFGKIKPPLVRTNAIAKNPNFKACHKLWNFLIAYEDVGYNIQVYEQSSKIDEPFTRDIYHSILFNYIILKNYLEDPKDREIDLDRKYKKKKLKPKFVEEIIEEIVTDYNLPDVVVKKVLIEEITKAQLMLEEEAERRRLVEEKEKEMLEQKRREEAEQERLAKEAEKERVRQEREAVRERMRQEKERETEQERLAREKERKEQADMKKGVAYKSELEKFKSDRASAVEKRRREAGEEARRVGEEKERIRAEEEAARKKAELEEQQRIERLEQEKEKERLRKEKQRLEAKEKAAQAEKERKARERARTREKAAKEKAAQAEKERLAREKTKEKEKAAKEKAAQAEKERLAREKTKEKEKAAKEKAAQAEKERLAREKTKEKEKAAKEKAAQAEKERLAREKAKEKEKAAKEKAAQTEKERLAREKAREKERTAKEKAKTAPKSGKTPAASAADKNTPVPPEKPAGEADTGHEPASVPGDAGDRVEAAAEIQTAVPPAGGAEGTGHAPETPAEPEPSEREPAVPPETPADAGRADLASAGEEKTPLNIRSLGKRIGQLFGFREK